MHKNDFYIVQVTLTFGCQICSLVTSAMFPLN